MDVAHFDLGRRQLAQQGFYFTMPAGVRGE